MEGISNLYDVQAEQKVLGIVLCKNSSMDNIDLVPEDFYSEAHRSIYSCMVALYEKGSNIDVITLVEELKKNNKLADVGGIAYLTNLDKVIFDVGLKECVDIVREYSVKRSIVRIAEEAQISLVDGDTDTDSVISRLQGELASVGRKRGDSNLKEVFENYRDLMLAFDEKDEQALSTGYKDIDRMLSGLRKGALTILAARPAMGKTALALNIAQNVAFRQDKVVLIFSLEMTHRQLMVRVASSMTGVDSKKILTKEVGQDQEGMNRLWGLADLLEKKPNKLFMADGVVVNPLDMLRMARQIKRKHGLDLVVVDYLQLMQGTGKRKNDSRVQEVSEISRALKLMALELDIPVLALSQLSRSVENRSDKTPMLSDLRESGSIEQDADVVMFLYRDEYYNPGYTEEPNIARCIIAKNRNGSTGTIYLYFKADTMTFHNLAKEG